MNNKMHDISLKKSVVKCTYMTKEEKKSEIPYRIIKALDLSKC
jgi:hypothetical protein